MIGAVFVAGAVLQLPAAEFPVPDEIERRADFWERVFTEWDSKHIAIHDRDHLDVVWKVVDTSGYKSSTAASRRVSKEMAELEKRLRRLEKRGKATDSTDAVLLSLIGNDVGRLKGAAHRLRAQRGIANHFEKGLVRARKLYPQIRTTLIEHGVPEDLAALPFVESGYNPKAYSWAGAAGLWQLMPATARENGLTVTRKNDERMNITEATIGAAKILAGNYKMLDSWPLAITGYNHGPYGVRRAVGAVGSNEIDVLIHKYQSSSWGFASKNFYAEFVAASRIMKRELALGPEESEPSSPTLRPAPRGLFNKAFYADVSLLRQPFKGSHGYFRPAVLGRYALRPRRASDAPVQQAASE